MTPEGLTNNQVIQFKELLIKANNQQLSQLKQLMIEREERNPLVKIHTRNIDMDSLIFGKSDYEDLCKYMNWRRTDYDKAKEIIKSIDIEVKVNLLKEVTGDEE